MYATDGRAEGRTGGRTKAKHTALLPTGGGIIVLVTSSNVAIFNDLEIERSLTHISKTCHSLLNVSEIVQVREIGLRWKAINRMVSFPVT